MRSKAPCPEPRPRPSPRRSAPWRSLGAALLLVACLPPQRRPTSSPASTATDPTLPSAADTPSTPPRDPAAPPPSAPADARTTQSGVAVHLIEAGDPSGPTPTTHDRLELRYAVFDEQGQPLGASRSGRTELMEMSWLPPGWAEAMLLLHEGDRAHVWVPAAMAYADHPDAPQGALTIDVELVALHSALRVNEKEVPLTAPPPYAISTPSGVSFVVLRAGTGVRHPQRDSRVTVHYEGWTADGNRFDSSVQRGSPTTFPLGAVISGWQEAVPLMVEGEKTRFWIPADLAYGDSPGKPAGMLIFDIELISIDD